MRKRNLQMHDQIARQRFIEREKKAIHQGKIAAVCFIGMVLIVILAIWMPANAGDIWQSVSDKSLVDMYGEE